MKRGGIIRLVLALLCLVTVIPVENGYTAKGGQGVTGARFLEIPVGARATSMGEAYTAVYGDAWDIFYNPAALSLQRRAQVAGQHLEFIGGIKHNAFSLVRPLSRGWNWGISGILAHSRDFVRDEFDDHQSFNNYDINIQFTLARHLTNRISAGATFKYIYQQLFVEKSRSFAGDFGIFYQSPVTGLNFGAAVRNLGSRVKFVQFKFPLPLEYVFGTSYGFGPFVHTLDFIIRQHGSNKITSGLEYAIVKSLKIRAGYTYDPDRVRKNTLSGGLGVSFKDFAVDYAFVPFGKIGNTHRVSSQLTFGPTYQEVMNKEWGRPMKLHGSYNLTTIYNDIDNTEISYYYPQFQTRFNYVGLGKYQKKDVVVRVKVQDDQWNEVWPKNVYVDVSDKKTEVELGDFIANFTPYTIKSLTVRGVKVTKQFEEPQKKLNETDVSNINKSIASPYTAEQIPDLAQMAKRTLGRSFFKKLDVTAIVGRSKEPLNIGDKRHENARRSTFGVYEQFVYGTQLKSRPSPKSEMSANIVVASDDVSSIDVPGKSVRPIKTVAITTAGHTLLFNDHLRLSGEFAINEYDRDRISSTDQELQDQAWFVQADHRYKNLRSLFRYERINPGYFSDGRPYLRTLADREIWKGEIEHSVPQRYSLLVGFQRYDDNLDHQQLLTTRTDDYNASINVFFPEAPNLLVRFSKSIKRSNTDNDTSLFLNKVMITSQNLQVNLTHKYKRTLWRLQFSRTKNVNSSEYASGIEIPHFIFRRYYIFFKSYIGEELQLTTSFSHNSTDVNKPGRDSFSNIIRATMSYPLVSRQLVAFLNWSLIKQKAPRTDWANWVTGARIQYFPSASSSLDVELKKDKRVSFPEDKRNDYRTNRYSLKYTRIF